MTMQNFVTEIQNTYNKYLPASQCIANYDVSLYRSIGIRCYLSNSQKECANNIRMNDIFNISFTILFEISWPEDG